MGDILMLSGVMKQCLDYDPEIRFNLVRRSIYAQLLKDHPAIACAGYPPADAKVITTDYWAKEKLGKGDSRAYQVLARIFGLPTPVPEKLFLPGQIPEDKTLQRLLPDPSKPIVSIAPSSVSPRKMFSVVIWKELVTRLKGAGFGVVQLGGSTDQYIPGAWSLLGQTTPLQLLGILKNSILLIGVDNFIMHAAHLLQMKALIIWGPTDPDVYGYPEQLHVKNPADDCIEKDRCLGPETPGNYPHPCPFGEEHCMNMTGAGRLFDLSMTLLDVTN